MKTIVVYYSNTGSNKYLAEKIASSLKCEIEAIQPKLNQFFILLLASVFNMRTGIKNISNNLETYDRTILCGPIWMGKFIAPLRGFIKKYKSRINQLYFVTCCGSTDETRNDKFGYATVFPKVEQDFGKPIACEAFPIALVLPKEKIEDSDAIMNTRLSDQNFNGRIQERYDKFIARMNS